MLHPCVDLCHELLRHLQVVLVTMGEHGLLVARRGSANDPLPLENDDEVKPAGGFVVSAKHYPVQQLVRDVACVSGAGDCFAAGFISAALRGADQDLAVGSGMEAARFTLGYSRSVPVELSRDVVDWTRRADGKTIL